MAGRYRYGVVDDADGSGDGVDDGDTVVGVALGVLDGVGVTCAGCRVADAAGVGAVVGCVDGVGAGVGVDAPVGRGAGRTSA